MDGPLSPQAIAAINRLLDVMRLDDAQLIYAMLEAPDQVTTAALIHAYLRDVDRADRTPREILYLLVGLQQAIIQTLLQDVVH